MSIINFVLGALLTVIEILSWQNNSSMSCSQMYYNYTHINTGIFWFLLISGLIHTLLIRSATKTFMLVNFMGRIVEVLICVYGIKLIAVFQTAQRQCGNNSVLYGMFLTIIYCFAQAIPTILELVFTVLVYPVFLCCFLSGRVG
jgi:hypothetical protein